MLTLALDVDGVLLDPDRNGNGLWTNELTARFGIGEMQLREAFFTHSWNDIITGRRSIEGRLAEALAHNRARASPRWRRPVRVVVGRRVELARQPRQR